MAWHLGAFFHGHWAIELRHVAKLTIFCFQVNAFSVAIVTKDFQPEKYESFTKILSECYSLTGSPASLLESYLAVATRGKCKSHDNGIFVSTEFDPRHAFVAASVKGESDVKINSSDARDRIFHLIWSKPYLLMPWLLKSPGHQQEWYWQYRISGFELNISKMGSWNHMGQTGNLVIKDFIRQMCVPLENSVYFDDGDGFNSNPEYATCTVAPLWIWSSSVEQNPRYYKRQQYDETLSATGGCTTANDVVILQTVPVPKVTLLWCHDTTRQNTAVGSRRPSAPW